MENAADALKIAFAIFVFVVAGSLLFIMVSKTISTADTLFWHTDKTNFYDWYKSDADDRIATKADIVSAIYKYYYENNAVKVIFNNGDEYVFDLDYESNEGNLTEKFNNETEILNNLNDFMQKLEARGNTTFTEEFVEVPFDGIILDAVDGTEIVIADKRERVYVVYREK